MSFVQKLLLIIIRCLEDANDHTVHKFSLSIMVLILIGCSSFTRQSIQTAGKTAHVLKVANFMINLKNTKLLSFLYMFRSCKPGLIMVSTENLRGITHIMKKKTMKQPSHALWH